ncbi:MAG: D-tyrosyl-tRNA(Tyr) deacylase [Clostridiales bacterium]|nr:D-tyrosyl-tRNA(Tyr) deacylase [Clostridiales bacterium]
MVAVLQRVSSAQVISDGVLTGKIGPGLAILLGVFQGDQEKDAEALAVKISKLRIFNDENDKMNLSVLDISGSAIVVSNFSLCANYKHGNRPDYLDAEKPERANQLYEYFVSELRKYIGDVQTGVFGAKMAYSIENDGPITIVMDSKVLLK